MFFGKKKNNEEIGPSRGMAALLHKTVMFLLYPFRKPLRFVVLLLVVAAIAVAVPVFVYQAKPQEVHLWYLNKIKDIDTTAITETLGIGTVPGKGTDQLVEMPQTAKAVRRQMFEKASRFSAPQPVDVMAEESADVVQFKPVVVERVKEAPAEAPKAEIVPAAVNTNVLVAKKNDDTGAVLRYLDNEEEISGTAKVYNANEMEVGGTYVFLYGVYSNPKSGRGVKAAVFLRSLVKGENVKCNILAYTRDNIATAECFVGNVNINAMLVEKGFSDKVTLE